MKYIQTQLYHSPCGDLLLGSFEDRLCLCDWHTGRRRGRIDRRLQRVLDAHYEKCTSGILQEAERQLDEYFNRKRTVFDIPLLFAGTVFQERTWHWLLEIPYGETVSYATLARRMGCPKSARAVANANGANAISVIVPCHRVIGSNGTLTGYGGGLAAKKYLLGLEAPTP